MKKTIELMLLVLLASLVSISAKFELRNKEDALRAHDECRDEQNIPDELFEQFASYQFPEHKKTNCYVKCWVEKMGLFTEQRGFNEKNIIAQFTAENNHNLGTVRHGLEKCIDHNEWDSDICTWANRVFSCWLKVNRHVVRKTFLS